MKIINLISGPRNLSTALMYSFAQRDDTAVLDEPFYASYLRQHPTIATSHPAHEQIINAMETHQPTVVSNIQNFVGKEILFIKGMAHHFLEDRPEFLLNWENIILIRHPEKLLASFSKVIAQPTLADIGTRRAAELFTFLKNNGKTPQVIDSDELLKAPDTYLQKICAALQIPYTEKMLTWKLGGIPEDGIWAKHWYANVHNSQGFEVQPTSLQPMPKRVQPVLKAALPYYNQLKNHILKNDQMLQKRNPKNDDLQVYVKDGLYHRDQAKVSVFDSSVQGGDAVWEGLRVYPEGIVCLDKHLTRLQESAKTLAFVDIPSKGEIKKAIKKTLEANGMNDETHIRLTLTRGEKITSGMDPRLNQGGSCLIVLAEWKPLVYDNASGIKVISTSVRRNAPQYLDSKIHHNNLLNNIIAKIQANVAGKDAGLMLDDRGFVAELNGSNLFMVKDGKILTPYAHACLPGITRATVIQLCQKHDIAIEEQDLTLSQLYNADGVFATGTMGELTPVVEIDGREITQGNELMQRILTLFVNNIRTYCEPLI